MFVYFRVALPPAKSTKKEKNMKITQNAPKPPSNTPQSAPTNEVKSIDTELLRTRTVSPESKAVSKYKGYGVDKAGYLTMDFNIAAGLPRDVKLTAKSVENVVKSYENPLFFMIDENNYSQVDVAKRVGKAYKVLTSLINKGFGELVSKEEVNALPRVFDYDFKAMKKQGGKDSMRVVTLSAQTIFSKEKTSFKDMFDPGYRWRGR